MMVRCAVTARCHAGQALEEACEMGLIREAEIVRNVGDARTGRKALLRLPKPCLDVISVGRHPLRGREGAGQMEAVELGRGRKLSKPNVAVVMLSQIVDRSC